MSKKQPTGQGTGPVPPRDADDLSQLPDAVTSAPGEKKGAVPLSEEETLELSDLAPDLTVFATGLGGTLTAAAEVEGESETPAEFLVLSPPARMACRLRAGGTKIAMIARLMRYSPASIGQMCQKPVAKAYILWLQERMDNKTATVQQAMQMLLPTAFERVAGIVQNSKNEGLVAKCSFQLFDRVMGKATEHIEVTTNGALTQEDIAAMKAADLELARVLDQNAN